MAHLKCFEAIKVQGTICNAVTLPKYIFLVEMSLFFSFFNFSMSFLLCQSLEAATFN